jgi:hypothetical protein
MRLVYFGLECHISVLIFIRGIVNQVQAKMYFINVFLDTQLLLIFVDSFDLGKSTDVSSVCETVKAYIL